MSFKKFWVRLAASGVPCADLNLGRVGHKHSLALQSVCWTVLYSRGHDMTSINGPMDLASRVVQCRLQGSDNTIPGSGSEEQPPKMVGSGRENGLAVVRRSTETSEGGCSDPNFYRNWYRLAAYCHPLATVAADYGKTQLGFVADDERDQVEVVALATTA